MKASQSITRTDTLPHLPPPFAPIPGHDAPPTPPPVAGGNYGTVPTSNPNLYMASSVIASGTNGDHCDTTGDKNSNMRKE
jgi:hypothetical protein